MDIKTHDLCIGAMEEERIQPILEEYFNTTLTKTEDGHYMDFRDIDGDYYEIKSRGHPYGTFPTTMISQHKLKFCKTNPEYNHWFIFAFTNGDYIYKYNKDDRILFGIGGRKDRGKDETQVYCYIPIELLKKIQDN